MQQLLLTDISSLSVESTVLYNIMTILMGFTLSILSLLLTVIKGVSIGYLFINNLIPTVSFIQAILLIITLILSLTGALLVTKMEIRLLSLLIKRNFNEIFSKIKVPLKDLILTVSFIIIIIIISIIIALIL